MNKTKLAKTTLAELWNIYKNHQVISMFFLGFSSGLPFMLIFSSLSFWLSEAGVNRSTIGFFSWTGLAFGFKWVWSPLVDRVKLPFITTLMGKRRSWLLVSQLCVLFFIICLSQTNPVNNLWHMAFFSLGLAFSAATQDIVIDAYRIESAPSDLQAAMAATYQIGYRIAMIISGAGVLAISSFVSPDQSYSLYSWSFAYLSIGAIFLIGIITTFLVKESEPAISTIDKKNINIQQHLKNKNYISQQFIKTTAWIYNVVISPFGEFFLRYKWKAVLVLLLICTYRISDIVLGVMANPFYHDIGFTKSQIAAVSKVYGVIMTLIGATYCGLLIKRFGIIKILFLGALTTSLSNFLFAILTVTGPSVPWLCLIISVDNLSGGIATSAFVAWLSSLTNINYTASQYALFSSLMLLIPKFIAGFSGIAVSHAGYTIFFIATALMGLPVLFFIYLSDKHLTIKTHR